ncbi:hypothetical protein BDK51DRAFT_41115 [Blyttiomyces helicus]|uniref:Uncharacterized protein n=1 Tax=Blyttiomyces helicus TaxID=388810 RepID=A0A4P9WMQ6_9FUNG|nr:hypothetical protein BDK51DRAFT_41115 [Blyttiomyces helicus]|eukprot:RKO92470.1 hypothetical protein BDK51DRAFT_41115 [Blyttiomyces helicus]
MATVAGRRRRGVLPLHVRVCGRGRGGGLAARMRLEARRRLEGRVRFQDCVCVWNKECSRREAEEGVLVPEKPAKRSPTAAPKKATEAYGNSTQRHDTMQDVYSEVLAELQRSPSVGPGEPLRLSWLRSFVVFKLQNRLVPNSVRSNPPNIHDRVTDDRDHQNPDFHRVAVPALTARDRRKLYRDVYTDFSPPCCWRRFRPRPPRCLPERDPPRALHRPLPRRRLSLLTESQPAEPLKQLKEALSPLQRNIHVLSLKLRAKDSAGTSYNDALKAALAEFGMEHKKDKVSCLLMQKLMWEWMAAKEEEALADEAQ